MQRVLLPADANWARTIPRRQVLQSGRRAPAQDTCSEPTLAPVRATRALGRSAIAARVLRPSAARGAGGSALGRLQARCLTWRLCQLLVACGPVAGSAPPRDAGRDAPTAGSQACTFVPGAFGPRRPAGRPMSEFAAGRRGRGCRAAAARWQLLAARRRPVPGRRRRPAPRAGDTPRWLAYWSARGWRGSPWRGGMGEREGQDCQACHDNERRARAWSNDAQQLAPLLPHPRRLCDLLRRPSSRPARAAKRAVSPVRASPARAAADKPAGSSTGSPSATRHRPPGLTGSPPAKMVRQARGTTSRRIRVATAGAAFRKPAAAASARTPAEATAARLTARTSTAGRSAARARLEGAAASDRKAAPHGLESDAPGGSAAREASAVRRTARQQAEAARRLAAGRHASGRGAADDSVAPTGAPTSPVRASAGRLSGSGARAATAAAKPPAAAAAPAAPSRRSSAPTAATADSEASTASSTRTKRKRPLPAHSGRGAGPSRPKPLSRPALPPGRAIAATDSPRARNKALLAIVVAAIEEAASHTKVSNGRARARCRRKLWRG